ncbi:hypothetical protein MO973_42385 [Paenibacillus sp. TRM 82003]|nr:hypothetical protein [Paenibacillus sp. TRM 82003]
MGRTDDEAQIAVKGKGSAVLYTKSRIVDRVETEDTKLFEAIVKESEGRFPYVALGEQIAIHRNEASNDTCELTDYILNKDGSVKYPKAVVASGSVAFVKGDGAFELRPSMTAHLSSDSKDYEPGAVIRGFKLACRSENRIREYDFILRTDAQ